MEGRHNAHYDVFRPLRADIANEPLTYGWDDLLLLRSVGGRRIDCGR